LVKIAAADFARAAPKPAAHQSQCSKSHRKAQQLRTSLREARIGGLYPPQNNPTLFIREFIAL
jgi:hypothetical protein